MDAWSGAPTPVGLRAGAARRSSCRARSWSRTSSAATATPRRRGRPARPGARRRRDAAHARPADPPGAPGRRQHAGLRQEPDPAEVNALVAFMRDAASGERTAGADGRRPAAPKRSGRTLGKHRARAWRRRRARAASWRGRRAGASSCAVVAAAALYVCGWSQRYRDGCRSASARGRLAAFLGRARARRPRGGVAARRARRPAPAGPHDAAPAPDDGGAAASRGWARRSPRCCCGLPRRMRRAVVGALASRAPTVMRTRHASRIPALAGLVRDRLLGLAYSPRSTSWRSRSDAWHHVEHACFFATAMLFWRPVILAWPARSPWPRWAMIPYLAAGRPPEHRALGDPDVLRPRHLPGVRAVPRDRDHLRARGPGGRGRDHVGAGRGGLPCRGGLAGADRHRGAAAPAPVAGRTRMTSDTRPCVIVKALKHATVRVLVITRFRSSKE